MHATAAATAAFAARHPALAANHHFRKLRYPTPAPSPTPGLNDPPLVASLGLGTYLGQADNATDAAQLATLQAAFAAGVNLFDTAINYRHQRSERTLGRFLATVDRASVLVCSKAGFLPFDADLPPDPGAWLRQTWLQSGLVPPGQLAAGCHCMAPVYLAGQLQRSLDNLGLDSLDVFYIHNPETQQAELSREEFYRRLRAAFELLEKAAAAGRIQFYGIATWDGLRVPPDHISYLDLNRMVATAREIAGETHRFRFVQLPYNLTMPEAYVLMNQVVDKPPYVSLLNAAFRLGVNVIASSTLAAGRLREIPPDTRQYLAGFLPPAASDPALALQFVRSTSSLQAGLFGTNNPDHLAINLNALQAPPSPPAKIGQLLQQ